MADSHQIFEALQKGDRVALSKGITLVENNHPKYKADKTKLINLAIKHSKPSFRVGITGVPGAGKSSLIEVLGMQLIEKGHRVAVLAIDPSSSLNKGSILGDKTRMEQLSKSEYAFIRPTPTASSLGGVAQSTREAILLCEAAGFDMILIETVGVGQSETLVHGMVDFFLLLLLPGAGDELQGIKRGIIEMADAFILHKADKWNEDLMKNTERSLKNALHLFPEKKSLWRPEILQTSALKKHGIKEIIALFNRYKSFALESNYLLKHRKEQNINWFSDIVQHKALQYFFQNNIFKNQYENSKKILKLENANIFTLAEELFKDI